MIDGRKIDKELYRTILSDINKMYNGDPSLVDDNMVETAFNETGGDLKELFRTISLKAIGDDNHITDDYIEEIKDYYHVVDPKATKRTIDYLTDEERLSLLPERSDERHKRRLDVSFDSIDEFFASEGKLTPRQKQGLYIDRMTRMEARLANVDPVQRSNQLYEYAKQVSNDLGMVYNPLTKSYEVPEEEKDRYLFMLDSTFLDPKEIEIMKPTIADMKTENEEIAKAAELNRQKLGAEEAKEAENMSSSEITRKAVMTGMSTAITSGEVSYKAAYMNAAGDLAKSTGKTLELIERLREGGNAADFKEGLIKGVKDHVTNVTSMLRNVIQISKVTDINNKLKTIHEKVLTDHPEWRYRDRPLYSNGEMIPPDDQASINAKEGYINQEINRRIPNELTEDEVITLNAYSANVRALEQLQQETGFWFNVGNITGASLGFMTEFALTGGMASAARVAVGKGLAKGITKIASKNMVKMLSDSKVISKIAQTAGKAASTKVGNILVKGGSRIGANSAESAIQVVMQPTFMANVANDIARGVDVKNAVFDNFTEQWKENFTERIFVGGKPKYKPGARVSAMKKAFDKFMYRGGFAGYGKRTVTGKVLGYVEEVAEEKISDLMTGAYNAIDKGSMEYINREIFKPEDVEMLTSVAIMSAGLGIMGKFANIGRPKSVESIRYKTDRIGGKLPSALRNNLDAILDNPTLTMEEQSTALANEINSGLDGLFDESVQGAELVKKKKDMASVAFKYVDNAMQLRIRESVENESFEEEEDEQGYEQETEAVRYNYNGKEVTITDTEVDSETDVEVVDAEGNKMVVKFNDLAEIDQDGTATEATTETIEQQNNINNAQEINELREESQGTEQTRQQESKPVGSMPEVNGTETTQEKVADTPEARLKNLTQKILNVDKSHRTAKGKAQDVRRRLKGIRDLIRASESDLTPGRYKKIMNSLSSATRGTKTYGKLLEIVNKVIADQLKENKMKQTKEAVNAAKKYVKDKVHDQDQKKRLNSLLSLDPESMDAGDASLFHDIVTDISEGRLSELTDYLVDNYFIPESDTGEMSPDDVQKMMNSINNKIKNMGDSLDIAGFEELSKYLRVLSNIRSRVAKAYGDGNMTEEQVAAVNKMIDEFMQGEEGFIAANDAARQQIVEIAYLEVEDAMKKHPYSPLDPTSIAVNTIYTNMDVAHTLNNRQLSRLYNALYSLNNGFYTKELNMALTDLLRHRVKGALINNVVPAMDRSKDFKSYKRWKDRTQKLQKELSKKDMNTAEYLFWVNEGTPFYNGVYQVVMEPASIAAESAKAKILENISKMFADLGAFHYKGISFGGKHQTYLDLIGAIMAERDYQQNTLEGDLDTVPEDRRSYINIMYNTQVPNKRWRRRYDNLMPYLKYSKDGFIDVEASLDNVPESDRKIVKNIFNEARRIFDGPLKDFNKLNAINRGMSVTLFDNDYFARQAVGKSIDIPAIETLEQMTNKGFSGQLGAPSAIKARTGLLSFCELDISKVISSAVEEATMEFFNVNAFNAVVGGINEVARAEEKTKKDNASMNVAILRELAQSTKSRIVSVYHLDKINNPANGMIKVVQRYMNTSARTAMLVNAPKLVTEVVTNWVGAMISDGVTVNPLKAAKNIEQVKDMREMFDYYNVVDANTMMKYTEISRAARGTSTGKTKKMVDEWIRFGDKITSSNIYLEAFNAKFKELTGSELDIDRWRNDEKYKRDITRDFMIAHGEAVNRTQASFSTLAPVSQSTHTQLLPFVSASVVNRDGLAARAAGFMLSFAIKESEMMMIGWRKMKFGIMKGDSKLAAEGAALFTSRLVRSMAYPLLKPQVQLLFASTWAGDDDDDGAAWIDMPERLLKASTQNVFSLMMGRYANVAELFESIIMGLGVMAVNDDIIPEETFEDFKNLLGYTSWAKPMSLKKVSFGELINQIVPGIGFCINTLDDNYDSAISLLEKQENGEPLTSDEQELYGIAGALFELMTIAVPNVFTANLRSIAKDGAAYKRRVKANKEMEKEHSKATGMKGISWKN